MTHSRPTVARAVLRAVAEKSAADRRAADTLSWRTLAALDRGAEVSAAARAVTRQHFTPAAQM